MTAFQDLGLSKPLLEALAAEGYESPTAIQARAIPVVLAGRDMLGIAQTGTGKTAAFVLPILNRLLDSPNKAKPKSTRVLVLTPTRELAVQVGQSVQTYGRNMRVRATTVFGGVGLGNQIRALERGVDVLVATPGRLLDLMNQRHLSLDSVEAFVLDEADRMFDMGFVRDVRKIAASLPEQRLTLLFSATMPEAVRSLASTILRDPETVEVAPPSTTAERVDQRVLYVERPRKTDLLLSLMADKKMERVLVFARTKRGADRLARSLVKAGVNADALHGDRSQGQRQKALAGFSSGKVRALVATDIAARGIDVEGLAHVVNYDLPEEPESYVHRIGRTARAGNAGLALTLCSAEEIYLLRAIEKSIRKPVPVDAEHPWHAEALAVQAVTPVAPPKRGNRGAQTVQRQAPRNNDHGRAAQQRKGGRPVPAASAGRKGHEGGNEPVKRGNARPQRPESPVARSFRRAANGQRASARG